MSRNTSPTHIHLFTFAGVELYLPSPDPQLQLVYAFLKFVNPLSGVNTSSPLNVIGEQTEDGAGQVQRGGANTFSKHIH